LGKRECILVVGKGKERWISSKLLQPEGVRGDERAYRHDDGRFDDVFLVEIVEFFLIRGMLLVFSLSKC
jgi:hypothetical protein